MFILEFKLEYLDFINVHYVYMVYLKKDEIIMYKYDIYRHNYLKKVSCNSIEIWEPGPK